MTAKTTTFSDALLAWYEEHARVLPWRNLPGVDRPGDPAWPYRVWLSEVMLQQTTIAAVKPYFAKFVSAWPTVEALAEAPEAEVMAAWAGLGYYSRARNLLACAREVAARGKFPETEAELRQLPGLGPYTAAAVSAIAFGRRAAVVDANVERVVARLFAIETPLPGARKEIGQRVEQITPAERAGDFAQAMMDLGAQVCTPRDPKCLLCPVSNLCSAHTAGIQARLPVKAPKKAKPERRGRAFWIESDGAVWLVTRPGSGMLGGMRALPDDGWSAQADGSGEAPVPGVQEPLGTVRHTFSHALLTLELVRLHGEPDGAGEWWPVDRIGEAGLPTLFAKAVRLALASRP